MNTEHEGLTAAERAEAERLKRLATPEHHPDRGSFRSAEFASLNIRTVERTLVCVECGDEFTAEVVSYGEGREIPIRFCHPCERKLDMVHEDDAKRGTPLDVMDIMHQLGVNVPRHGHLRLSELGDLRMTGPGGKDLGPLVPIVREWCDTVLTLKSWQEVGSLYVYGATGTGKTQIAVCALRYLLERGYPAGRVVWDRARALITTIQDQYGSGRVDAVIERRREAGVWFLDDAGTEKVTPDAFRIVEDILDAREGHATMWSTNDAPDKLTGQWASTDMATFRFRSRLNTFRFLPLVGTDRRFK